MDALLSHKKGDGKGHGGSLYGYVPWESAAIAFITLFALLTFAHLGLLIRSRIWWLVVLSIGGVAEIIGWAGRLWSAKSVKSLDAFLTQQICLILAPCFFSAMVYGTLGSLIKTLGPQFSRLRPNLYLIIFCIADLLAIVIQAIGGAKAALALQSNNDTTPGTHIMVAGIAVQLLGMVVFSILGCEFFWRTRSAAAQSQGKVNLLAFALAFSSFWILVRCVYRVVELAQGWKGYLITHQPYFIALDAIPMVFALGVFVPCHPYLCLPQYKENPDSGASTPLEEVEK
ncbi:RTA1-domain-containing protein [Meredithblackwellia eburnea MCA 4105]